MDTEASINCLMFGYREALFAIRTAAVSQSIWIPELAQIEGMPYFVVGVFDFHGVLVPVIDLDLRFGHPARADYRLADQIVVTMVDGSPVGLIVNEVLDVRDVQPLPIISQLKSEENHWLIQEVEVDGQIAMLLDHARLLDPDEFSATADQLPDGPAAHVSCFASASKEERAVLRERAATLMAEAEHLEAESRGVVVVSLAGERFSFDLGGVAELADMGDVVPVPCCPPHIAGNMNLRGDIVTLVDMRSELHLPFGQQNAPGKVVISKLDQLLVGVPVDEIHEVLYVDPAQYKPVPAAVRQTGCDYVRGEIPYDKCMATVIDLKTFFARPELVVDLQA